MRRRLPPALPFYLLLIPIAFSQTVTLGLNASQLYEKGMSSLMGAGISRSDMNAVDYLRRSAELGYPPAQVVLEYFYETGSPVSHDPGQAADWYRKAAKQDDRLADWLLGRLYYTGDGIPRDFIAAESWLRRAAKQGDPFGEYLLGLICWTEMTIPRRPTPSAKLRFKACLKRRRSWVNLSHEATACRWTSLKPTSGCC
ncbi:MAG: tetratricopeptide repeat protein [Terriglobales bacterium]